VTASDRAPQDQAAVPRPAGQNVSDPAWEGLLSGKEFVEIRMGGSGGQGVVLMGIILAVAANHDGRCVVQTESYGPEARGGYSRSDVIISDSPIDYPNLEQADLLVALSQDSAHGYVQALRKDGVLIYDSERVATPPVFDGRTFGIPLTRLAVEETGRVQTTNVLTLGAIVGITGVVSAEAINKAVLESVPAGTRELNGKALTKGLSIRPSEWEIAG
jgi:2-oxoglutarate ferredoxin oxidoreductase subunit gamma